MTASFCEPTASRLGYTLPGWTAREGRLLVGALVAGFAARGGVVLGGLSPDDYVTLDNEAGSASEFVFSQGRFVLAATLALERIAGTTSVSASLPLGVLGIALFAILSVSVTRFLKLTEMPWIGLPICLMGAHPYGAELLTFKVALVPTCISVAACIFSLEALMQWSGGRGLLVAIAMLAMMLFTYQLFLGYVVVVVALSVIVEACGSGESNNTRRRVPFLSVRGLTFRLGVAIAASVSISMLAYVLSRISVASADKRTNFIGPEGMPERIAQAVSTILNTFVRTDPLMGRGTKMAVALLCFAAVLGMVLAQPRRRGHRVVLVLGLGLLVSSTVVTILPLAEWWPAPRVLSQVGLAIAGLLGVGHLAWQRWPRIVVWSIMTLQGFVLCAWIATSNAALRQELDVNARDRALAQRIVQRIDQSTSGKPGYLFVQGAKSAEPGRVPTAWMDLNLSAFVPEYSRVPAVNYLTGSSFMIVDAGRKRAAEAYCAQTEAWPAPGSVTIIGDTAVVCRGS